jgi:Tfp pilus assembly protein FimT
MSRGDEMKATKLLRQKRGFSLLSVLVAIALLTLLFVALTRGLITVQEAHRDSHYNTVANALGQAKLEELASQRYWHIASGEDNNPIDETGQPVAQGYFGRSWTVDENATDDMKTIEVTVEWDVPQWTAQPPSVNPKRYVRLATVVSKYAKTWL